MIAKTFLSLLIIVLAESKPSGDVLSELTKLAPSSFKQTVISGDIKFNIVINQTSGDSDAHPCSKCQPIYQYKDCKNTGFDCVPEADVGASYKRGPFKVPLPYDVQHGDEDTCSLVTACPSGTIPYMRYPIVNSYGPVPLQILVATCQETGPNAGNWYFGFDPLTYPVNINGVTCRDFGNQEPEDYYPCEYCRKLYDNDCLDGDSCLKSESVVSTNSESEVCSTMVSCPPYYKMRVELSDGRVQDGPSTISAHCQDDGTSDEWFTVLDDDSEEVSVQRVTCVDE